MRKNSNGNVDLHHPRLAVLERFLYIILSFILPLIIIIIALAGMQITPFGDESLVISDANGLYINTLSYAGRMLKGMEGLTYSFEKGLGGNMMGHLNGILLTPFAFLFSFSDILNYPTAFTFVSALNFSLAGLTMYLMLAELYGHKRSNLIFSTSYALMGFHVANVFQAYFFSAAPVLPIMVMGLRRIFKGKNPAVYILSIAYALITNAYFGFMLCAASLLFFITGLLLYSRRIVHQKKLICLNYIISSMLGGLLGAAIWIPSFLSLRGGRLEQTGIADFSFLENMPFLQIGAKLFTGANSTSELVNGLPNVFVGILPVAIVILFFIDNRTDKRKKTAAGVILCVYLLSFWIVAFNMMMHAGTTTNWFNYRYSYVFSFLLLLISADKWQSIEGIPLSTMKRGFFILVVFAILVFSKKYEFVSGGAVLLDCAILALIYLAWTMHKKKPEVNTLKLFEIIALILVCTNLFLNYRICTKKILPWDLKVSDYQETVSVVDPLVQGASNADADFYRIEITEQRSETCGNDPMLYGYNGVGHGGSNERNFVRTALSKLGVPWYDMRNYYAKGIPAATDNLLGLRYIISRDDLTAEKGYEKLIGIGEWGIFKNADSLPVAFLSDDTISTVETEYADVFENLNSVYCAISGMDTLVFIEETDILFEPHQFFSDTALSSTEARTIVAEKDASIAALIGSGSDTSKDSDSASSLSSESGLSITQEAPENISYISYSFIAREDGPIYVYNKSGLSETNGAATPAIQYMGNHQKGESVTGYIPVPTGIITDYVFADVAGRFRVAYADQDALDTMCGIVRDRHTEVTLIKDSHLEGSFDASANQKLMFTIPWDEGWTCWIDGEKIELTKVLDVFMVADVAPGVHTFEMKFVPEGLNTGLGISVCALAFTLLYLLLGKRCLYKLCARRVGKKAALASQSEVTTDDPV